MRLFNRLSDESRSNGNQEKKVFRGRKSDEGKRREGVAGSLSPRKLGMENLEERQLLSVNPIGNSEYADIRAAYADLELPSSLTQINVIELTDLNAAALQNAVDQAARTTADDLILLRTTADDYVVDLESTAINVNIDSDKYGSLTILGTGEQALTIETTDVNAFTVLNGDVQLGGAVLYNYSTNYAGQAIVESPDANVKLASSLVMIDQTTTLDENGVVKTNYLVDSAMTEEDAEKYGVSNITDTSEMRVEIVDGDYNQVRHRVHATLRQQYHYFGYDPSVYRAVSADKIYDASSNGAAGWVGTVANMMAYTGWAQEAGFSTAMTQPDGTVRYFESVEDAVAEYLRSGYLNTGDSFTCAQVLDYLFDGDDENCMGSNLSSNTNTVEGGGFFMDIDFTKVGGYTATSDSMIDDMLRALRDGNAVTLEIITTNNHGYQSREYVSVWGYYYNPNTLDSAPNGTSNGSADYLGLICSNPTKTTVQYQVTDNHYDHPDYQDPVTRTMTHYRDENDDGSNTYNTYLLERNGSSWRFAISPYTYFNDQGAVQGARTLPEGFSYYGGYQNSQNTTYTSELVGFSWLQQYNAKMHEAPITEAETLSLESMPGNTENVIYLHFAGVEGDGWDGLAHPALDLDGSAGYGVSELKMIQEVWARVAEDYAPFNVNVTTDPNVWANATNGVRCVIGGYSPSAGGLSYVGCFGPSKQDNYVYPYSLGLSAKNIAEAAAHEIGHAMGLSHDGYEHDEYYGGNATWGPIMGVGYSSAITQWSDGSYVNATNLQDDVAIIASKVGFRTDDFGNTIDMASKLDDHYVPIDINTYDPTAGTYTVDGVIENRDDYDIFSFVSHGGTYVVDVSGAGADHRFIDRDFSWDYIRHADVENAVFAGKYYASAYDYANLNLKVELLDENGEIVLLDMDGKIQKLGYGESIVLSDDYYYYVVDQFGKKVYNADGSLKEGYQAVDDSIYTTFSHFVTPELETGKTYYISVTGVGQGNDATNGFSDYGSLGAYTLSMHESYENFYIDDAQMDVESLDYATAVDNVLNWQEAFVYSGRRLEDGSRYLGNTLTFDASLSGQTLDLRETLRFTFSRSLVDQPLSEKRFVLDATAAWDAENDRPGITIDANEKFRVVYVDNTTVELYGFTFTGGVAETTNVIYLYFGGIDGPGWSGEAHPAYDLDGDPTSFNDAELEAINEIYLRVAEDYAPFNVTVTTDQDVFNAATNAVRVVVGGTGNDRGGVAYLNSFGTQKQDCYVFPNSLGSPKAIAEAISHEVGHTLGLSHDGQDATEYYGGTNGWAPIMGVGYYQPLTQFSKGEYQGATQTQDDLAYVAAYLGYKADDYSDKRANAAALRESYIRSGNFVADGLIERTGDADMFSFVATGSTYVIDVVGAGADFDRANAAGYAASLGYTNLDLVVELYDDAGNLLYTCDPSDSLFAHFEATGLTAGESYYVRVSTTGLGDPTTNGYSNYGALGQYYVTVAAGTLADFVGEERYTSIAQRNAINEGALNATKEKSETYGKNGQTNNGGGIYNNYGWLTIGDSVIAGNRALKAGGGVYNSGGEYETNGQHDGWLYLVNTSIVGNVVTNENSIGGGFYNESGGVATLVNVTVAGNAADYSGGGFQNAGRVYLYNSIIAKNEASYGADVYTQTGKYTRVYDSIIGDESRNTNYTAYVNGTNSINAGNSLIGTSRGSSVSAQVTTYDPKFVSYRGYDVADWSSELWKSWNLRLQGDSLAVDRGNSDNLTNDLDFGSGYVSNGYDRWGQNRYFFAEDYQTDLAGQPRFEGESVDAGAYEVLADPDLTEFVPTAGDVVSVVDPSGEQSDQREAVNDWESSIVISRAQDDQTGSVAPFLVDENLFLNLAFVNQGATINESFETTVYMWKYDPKTSTKQQMFADSKLGNNELALLNVKVDFVEGVSMPGADNDNSTYATITITNLATDEVQVVKYDGVKSYVALSNVAMGSIEQIINGFVDKGVLEAQNEEGYYVFGYQLDSGEALPEYSETNNFYLTTSYFDVVESPVSVNNSIVVTTTEDVVDAYDGEISLREAVEIYAGSFYYREVALPEGATFESGGVTYKVHADGKFYVDNTTDYRVYPGESFSFRETVSETIVWDAEQSAYVDAEGNVVALTNGDKATFTLDGVEYADAQWDEAASAWTVAGRTFAAADVAEATWTREAVVTVVYAEDVYFDADNKAVAVPNGTKGEINGVAVEMIDGVWTSVSQTTYDRDAIQAMGNFFLADGTEVAVVNGVFRRVATDSVAVVLDGSVVTLANGESAVYDTAKGVFVVTTTVEYPMTEGAKVVVDGVELTFVERAYVDSGDYRYYLSDGVVVTLANGYEVEYDAKKDAFVFRSENLAAKIDAGATILWNGETYAYKAGVAIVQKVSREANAVVFDASLDEQTFVLTQGELTLTTSFTLDCVDPDGNLLDLTIQGVNSRLFTVETGASVEIKNFKLANSSSSQDGGVVYNKGTLTIDTVAFSGNESHGGVGGAIYNATGATLSVLNSTFSGDSARDGASIYNAGTATIQDSAFEATGEFGNGVVYNVGTLVVDNTQFAGSSTASSGGAIYNVGTADVSNSTFDGTAALNGGAIYNDGTLRLADSNFANVSASVGGAIYNLGSATVVAGSFKTVSATGVGGAIYNEGTVDVSDSTFDGTAGLDGGAIYNDENATLRLSDSDFANASAANGGAIYNLGNATIDGGSFENVAANGKGGAIYNEGTATLTGTNFADNTASVGGAVYSTGTLALTGVAVKRAKAENGAAIYSTGTLTVSNTLIAKNVATGLGGAIYNAGVANLTNATIADNEAADGAGLYNAGIATVDNSILAGNKATGAAAKGFDLYTVDGATTTLRSSLLANIAQYGDKAFDLVAAYRSFLGVDPKFVDAANGDYALSAISPAINNGSNALDGGALVDVDGKTRRVGLTVGGVVMSVDMGAYEYQTIIAPDLVVDESGETPVDYWQTEKIENGATTELDYFVAGQDVCIDFNVKNIGTAAVYSNFGYTVTLVGTNDKGEVVYNATQDIRYYASSFERFDWLNENDWIAVGGSASLAANLGALPAGRYTIKLTLDVGDKVVELDETNNVYEGAFNVFEAPSVVVTTEKDVVDPTDCVTSLREAVEHAGTYDYVSTFMVADGTQYVLEGGQIATVVDGCLTIKVDVVEKNGVLVDLQDGDEFLLNGRPIFYRYQVNGGYFAYSMAEDAQRADVSSGKVTFLNGEEANLLLNSDQYVEFVVDTELNPSEDHRYAKNFLTFPNGETVELVNGAEFEYANVKFAYYQNAEYPDGAFVFENGAVVAYQDGSTVQFGGLSIGTLQTRNQVLVGELVLEDGSRIQVTDGVARLTKSIEPTITFAESMKGKTIVLDAALGSIEIAKDLVIDGEDRGVTVDGDDSTGLFVVEENATVAIARLTATGGAGQKLTGVQNAGSYGGAIVNKGDLTLNDVDFVANVVGMTSANQNLVTGLGGAIYNEGTLTVDGGSFENNSASEFGGAIFSVGDLVVKNATFDGGKSFAGGAIAAQAGTLVVENTTFTGNVAYSENPTFASKTEGVGGAVYTLVDAVFTAVSFVDNQALVNIVRDKDGEGRGGAVYAGPNATIRFKADAASESTFAVSFEGNKATGSGGAVYTENDLTIEGDVIAKNNQALSGDGGAIYAKSVEIKGSLTAENNVAGKDELEITTIETEIIEDEKSIITTIVTTTVTTTVNGDGGAIYAADGDVSVEGDATLTGNEAYGLGGAIYAQNATFGASATFENNVANGGWKTVKTTVETTPAGAETTTETTEESFEFAGSGAAILVSGAVDVAGALVATGNEAADGSIISGATITVVGDATLSSNVSTTGVLTATGEVALNGALNATSNQATAGSIISGSTITVALDATLSSNVSTTGVLTATGAVALNGALNATGNEAADGSIISGSTITVALDATLSNNVSTTGTILASDAVSFGGALTATGDQATAGSIISGATITVVGDATLSSNVSTTGVLTATGAVALNGALNATSNQATAGSIISGSTITVALDATLSSNVSTTGVLTATGAVALNGALTAENNKTSDGSAVSGSTVTVALDAVLKGNEGTNGAAIFATGDVALNGALTAENNKATGSGGAIAAVGSLAVKGDATLTGNTATQGGALAANGAVSLGGSLTAANNTATTGGAIVSGATVTVGGDATLTGNTATAAGGAIAAVQNVEIVGALTASDNTAATGGAISANGSVAIGGALEATNNRANGTAGGVIVSGATVTVGGDATLSGNIAQGSGGAIAALQNVVIVGAATMRGNVARISGGAIAADGDVEIGGALNASLNIASDAGGAIVALGDVKLGDSATLTDNSAATAGGAISANGSLEIVGALNASGNVAGSLLKGGFGGAVAVGGDVTVGGDAILTGNKATFSGGAIYAKDGDVEIVGALTASDNVAASQSFLFETTKTETLEDGTTVETTVSTTVWTGDGGVIAAPNGAVSVEGDATLTNNTSHGDGGAIYAQSANFKANLALESNFAYVASESVVTTVNTTTAAGEFSSDTTIESKSLASSGGAIYAGAVKVGGDLTATENTALGDAGAIYASSLEVLGSATFSKNKALGTSASDYEGPSIGSGGAVYSTGSVAIGGALTVESNKANVFGGAIYAGAVEVGGDLTATGNMGDAAGGAIYASSLDVVGSATLANNATNTVDGEGGAVYSTGSVAIGGTLTATDNRAAEGGAFNVETLTVEGLAKLTGNKAIGGSGGAIYASTVALKDGALLTGNAATAAGGAIYALELALVSATVAGNSAADGGGLYVVDSATLSNTIVAGNKATAYEEEYETTDENGEVVTATRIVGGDGADVYLSMNGTATLRNSLLQNVENIGLGALDLVAENRSILGVDPEFNDAANGDYSLKATSPAINAGSNALAGASEVDLAGNSRYVGLTVDGVVYAIDMGAFECQTVIAPDLTFNENPVNFWYATVDGERQDYYIHGEDVVLDFSFLNAAASELEAVASGMVIDKFSISFVVTDANNEKVGETVYRYQPESDYCDWLSVSDWLDPDELVSYARQNLGVLPIGSYTLTITLDSDGEIVERGEEDGSEAGDNNVLSTTFNVYEAPSTVVTTDKDVVDPLDGEISLREAVEVYAGSYWYSSTILVEDGTQYVLDDYSQVTVKDGEATISRDYIAVDDQDAKRANDGDKFEYGSSYMTFVDGVVTYPDGTTLVYDGENPLEFENEDGDVYVVRPMDYYEYIMNVGQQVSDPNVPTVDVLIYPDGTIKALEHLEQTEFYYGKTWATYYEYVAVDAEGNAISFVNGAAMTFDGQTGVFQNGAVVFEDGSFARLADGASVELDGVAATYVGSAFVLPSGEVVGFVAGETLECENGSTIAMSQVDEVIDGVLDLVDGRRLELFGDGTAVISTEVKPYVTFAENLDGATIKVDSVITIDRDLTIDASDRTSVTVSGANKTNVFEVKADATATIISLSIKNALATNGVGAGITNYGNLSLVGVSISDSKATSDAEDPDVDKLPFENAILTEGVGGAIYNAGTLSIDGGSFEDNLATFHGGAIYSFGSLSIKNATFEGNEAKYFGGAVYVHEGETTFESTSFVGNEAGFGGAVYAFAGATFTSASFEGNVANSDGGAIYAASGATLNFASAAESAWAASFQGNVANRDGGAIYANSAVDVAGALVATGNQAADGSIISGLTITVGDATLTDNVSTTGVLTATGAIALNGALNATNNEATAGSIVSGATITVAGDATLTDNASTTGVLTATGAVALNGALTAENNKTSDGSAVSGSTVTVALDAVLKGNEGTNGAAIFATGDVALNGALTATGNVATGFGGAINSGASVTVEGLATLTGNTAANGGALYAKNVELKDGALLADNVALQGLGGAIYAETLTLVNATVAGNSAAFGGGLYVLGSATLSNTIVAGNSAVAYEEEYETTDENGEVVTATRTVGGEGADIYVAEAGTVTLKNSLLQNTEVGAGELELVAENRSILGVDPEFNDAANGDYSLKATSPAINAGSNALAGASDVDLAGNPRYVGLTVDGEVYAIDMGAFECQTVVAPDLTFGENPVDFWYASHNGGEKNYFVYGEDVVLDFSFLNAASTLAGVGSGTVIDKFSISIVVTNANGEKVVELDRRYQDGSDYCDWLSVSDWLDPDEVYAYTRQNLGALAIGEYTLTITLDSADEIVERGEEDGSEAGDNNVFTTTFMIRETPSVVVTTDQDVVDPFDGEISLREAVEEYAGYYWYSPKISDVVEEGATFVLAENAALGVPAGAVATYADGKLTVEVDGETVELAQNVEYALADGTKFIWQERLDCALVVRGDLIGSSITFAESVHGKTINLTSELTIDRSMTIDGTNANVVVSGVDASRIATVSHGTVSVFGLTFENGAANLGGAIYNAANLTLTDVAVKNSKATEDGGAIYNALGASLNLTNVEIVGASATNGGAIYNAGTLFGEEVAISGSQAVYGAGLYNVGTATFAGVSFADGVATAQGGAIYNDGGELVVDGGAENSSFVGNQAVYGGAIVNYQGVATIAGTNFVANKATGSAGAIDNYGELTLNGVVFENNEAAVAGGAIYNSESAANGEAYSVALQDVVFKGNAALQGGALYNAKGSVVEATGAVSFEANSAANEGGAIYNAGTATFATGATFSANTAATGGAIYNVGTATLTGAKFNGNVATADGGAVANVGTFNATTSEFVANVANGFGGALYNLGQANVANSLAAQNVATNGGAIANVKGATLELTNATIAANSATTAGGVHNLGTLTAYNTIIAANAATNGVDLFSNGSATLWNSLVGSTDGIGTKPKATDSLFDVAPGFVVAPVFDANGKLTNADALNLRLVRDAIAVDAGNNAYAKDATGKTTLTTDLDGGARIATKLANVDMGAYEFQFEEPSAIVTTDLDVVDVTDGLISLREALEYAAQLKESTVTFAQGLGIINLNSTLEIDKSITIDASTVGGVRLDAAGFAEAASAVAIYDGAKVALVSLEITNTASNATEWFARPDNDRPDFSGGGVWNAGELVLRDATITGNFAAYGGGLYNLGKMSVYNSTIANNAAFYYSGIYNRGELYVENSKIDGNLAQFAGGGLGNFAKATIVGTEFVGNGAETGAGVLALANLSGSRVAPSTTLINCTVVGNVAKDAGAGVWANDVLNVANTIIAGNVAKNSGADVYLAKTAQADVRYSLLGASNAKISGVGVKTNVDPNFVDFETPTVELPTAELWKTNPQKAVNDWTTWFKTTAQAWNLELALGSPAIDAGSTALAVDEFGVQLTTDLAGDKRVVGVSVDMGAYEEQGNVAPTGINVEYGEQLTTEDAAGTLVATLTTVDANLPDDEFEYELIDAPEYFALDGDKIVTTQNVPVGTYEFVVRSTDKGNKSVEATVKVEVVNPAAESYAAPTITSVAINAESALEVFWATGDPAKEYVVSYRVGSGDWVETNALTGEYGRVEGDFNVGDVVQVRIRALGSVDKNASEWSAVETYVVAEPPKAFDVKTNGDGALVTLTIDSNFSAVAYWRVAWGDGTETVVNELSTQRVFGHVYAATGEYEMKLFVNNDEVGYDLGVFEANVASSAVLETLTAETTNVFSAIAPVAVENVAPQAEEIAVSAALLADETVVWNEIAESLAVETTVETGVALTAAPTTRVERAVVFEALGAAFAEMGADDFETVDVDFSVEDAANETAFDDAFLSELFGD